MCDMCFYNTKEAPISYVWVISMWLTGFNRFYEKQVLTHMCDV